MTHRPIVRFSAVLAVALALTACHPGRHHGSVLPPGATTPPGTEPISPLGTASAGGGHGGNNCPKSSAASWGCPSTYALTSDPSGISVQRFDPSGQTTQYNVTLTTPATDPLPDSSTNLQYRFGTNNAAGPFTVNVQQIHDGAHQVYYNRNSDSTGHIDGSNLQSIARSVMGSSSVARPVANREKHRAVNTRTVSTALSDRLYVRFSHDALRASGRNVAAAIRALGTHGVELPTTNSDPLTVVTVPAGTTAQAYANTLAGQPGVAAVFPVHRRYTLSRTQTIPSDKDFILPNEWYLYATGFPYAWSYTKGAGATIAVIDTGVDLTNTDISPNVSFSETVVNGARSSSITDHDGHGTNVAGIADAVTGNDSVFGAGNHNFAGGGYSAKLIAINIFDSSTGFASGSDEALAIADALSHNADVINLSLGAQESFNDNQYTSASSWNGGYDEGEFEAIQAALAAGTTVVAAAGNDRDGKDSGGDFYTDGNGQPVYYKHLNLDYPAAYPGVISVGASALNDNGTGNYSTATEVVASYSQSAVGLSVVAPGGDANQVGDDNDVLHWIWGYYSTAASDPCNYAQGTLPHIPTNCTVFFNGTSQATPQVSAAVALLYSAAGGHHSLQPAAVKQLIEDTADNINDPYQGHGRLNVYRAVASLLQDTGATATGPKALAHSAAQMIAFAYNNSGQNKPVILDYDYPVGVPVASDGSFRIADVRPADATNFKVAVWLDVNGDGIVDSGDYFGAAASTCNVTSGCTLGTIRPTLVGSGTFSLP